VFCSLTPAALPFEFGLSGKGTDLRDLMDMTPEQVSQRQRDARHDLEATQKAAAILRKGGSNAYEKALRALLPDSLEWRQEYVGEKEYPATAEGLADFICKIIQNFLFHVFLLATYIGASPSSRWLRSHLSPSPIALLINLQNRIVKSR
jgi:hypothetical protein